MAGDRVRSGECKDIVAADVERATPRLIERAGRTGRRRFLEFFVVPIRNRNTREAYARATRRFLDWCEDRGARTLDEISPAMCAAYIEFLCGTMAAPSVKQHLAAINVLFDWLVVGQVLGQNPAASVKGPTHVVKRGKTPVLSVDETRSLFAAIDVSTAVGLRDRALIATMIYSHARVSAVLGMHIEDHYADGKHWWIRPNPILSMAMSVPTWVASSATPSCATAEGRRSPAMTR